LSSLLGALATAFGLGRLLVFRHVVEEILVLLSILGFGVFSGSSTVSSSTSMSVRRGGREIIAKSKTNKETNMARINCQFGHYSNEKKTCCG
jgi:hypothetical protein